MDLTSRESQADGHIRLPSLPALVLLVVASLAGCGAQSSSSDPDPTSTAASAVGSTVESREITLVEGDLLVDPVVVTPAGTWWVGKDGLTFVATGSEPTPVPGVPPEGEQFTGVVQFRGDGNNAYVLEGDEGRLWHVPLDDPPAIRMISTGVNGLLAATDEGAWVLRGDGGPVLVDPASGEAVRSLNVPGQVCAAAAGPDGELWTLSEELDVQDSTSLEPVAGRYGPGTFLSHFDGGSVFDATPTEPESSSGSRSALCQLTQSKDYVWVATDDGADRIDKETGEAVSVSGFRSCCQPVVREGTVWFATLSESGQVAQDLVAFDEVTLQEVARLPFAEIVPNLSRPNLTNFAATPDGFILPVFDDVSAPATTYLVRVTS